MYREMSSKLDGPQHHECLTKWCKEKWIRN